MSKCDCERPCCNLSIEGPDQERFVAMMKAAGNPIRFKIMKFLVTHPGCITGNIVDHLPIAQATVSQHLAVLRETGWIEGVTEGPATCYCLVQEYRREDILGLFLSLLSYFYDSTK